MAYDPEQGKWVQKLLEQKGLENPISGVTDTDPEKQRDHVELRMLDIMMVLGLNVREDASLKDTPRRVAKMYIDEIFYGLDYNKFPQCSTFPSDNDEMVAVKDIEVKSMCEHHFLPFIGTACVGYIPRQKVIGISKLNRIVDFFSRRPQMQERLTEQVAATVALVLSTEDVAVVIKAVHYCTRMRGVKDFSSETVTSKLLGRFKTVDPLRAEFIGLTR